MGAEAGTPGACRPSGVGACQTGGRRSAPGRGAGRSCRAARAWQTHSSLLAASPVAGRWPVAWGGRAVPEDGRVGVGLRSMRTAWGQARGERARGQPSHLPGRLSQLLKLGTPQQRRPDPCQPGREGVAGEPPRPLGRAGREVLCRRGHGRAGAWRPAGGEERAPSPAEGDANTRQLLPSRQFAQGPLLRGGAAPGRPAPGRLASWRTWGDGASGLLGPGASGGKRGVGRQGPRRPRRRPRRSRSLPPHPPSEQSRPSSCLQGAPGSPWVCIILSF